MRRVWAVCVAVLLGGLSAQAATGIWKNFTSMYDVRAIVRDGSGFWAATSGGLFHWSPSNDSYQLLTNADGLLSIDLTAIATDAHGNIWSGASTGIVDVYDPSTGSIRTILDIATAKDQTNKRINAIVIQGDTALICTDFGLTVFHVGQIRVRRHLFSFRRHISGNTDGRYFRPDVCGQDLGMHLRRADKQLCGECKSEQPQPPSSRILDSPDRGCSRDNSQNPDGIQRETLHRHYRRAFR